jgi:hypothetical protein
MSLGNIPNPTKEEMAKFKMYQSQLQLLTGWLNISDDMIRHEIETSAVRQGIDLANTHFLLRAEAIDEDEIGLSSKEVEWMVRDQKRDWVSFLRYTSLNASFPSISTPKQSGYSKSTDEAMAVGQFAFIFKDSTSGSQGGLNSTYPYDRDSYNGNGNGQRRIAYLHEGTVDGSKVYLVPIQAVCEGIFKMSTTHIPFRKISVFVFINTSLNVCINLYANRHDLGRSHWTIVFYICSTYMIFQWYFPLAFFMFTVVVDMYRQLKICTMLEELLRLCDVNIKEDGLGTTCSLACITKKLDDEDSGHNKHSSEIEREESDAAAIAAVNPLNTSATGDLASAQDTSSPPPMLVSSAYQKMASSGSGNDLFGYSNFLIPSLDLTYPQNLLSWCNCRIVLNTVGTRFKLRISIYTGAISELIVLRLLNHRSSSYILWNNSNSLCNFILVNTMSYN